MPVVSVAQAGRELGVSERRVRQMLAGGQLVGEKVGRVWIVERSELRRLAARRREVGRPWSPASAWAVLALADGREADLSPVDRSRARKRLALGLDRIVGRLAARCEKRWFYAHPGVLGRLAGEVVRAGISAAAHHGADLVVTDELEGYVRASDLDRLLERFALDDRAARPDVLLRVVADEVWPFVPGQRHADRSVVAVDLLESDDPRSRRAGAALLAQ